MTDEVASLSIRISADTSDARTKLKDLERLGNAFGSRITSAFEDAAFSGEGLGTTLKSLALDLSRLSLRGALQPLQSTLSSGFTEMFRSFSGFAKGGTIGSSFPQPFAAGGVISAPVAFPLSGGRTGIAGEAGPEAILPLTRDASGRLGVHAGNGTAPISVHMTVNTPDSSGFRRSEGQMTAMLARAMRRGQRFL